MKEPLDWTEGGEMGVAFLLVLGGIQLFSVTRLANFVCGRLVYMCG